MLLATGLTATCHFGSTSIMGNDRQRHLHNRRQTLDFATTIVTQPTVTFTLAQGPDRRLMTAWRAEGWQLTWFSLTDPA